MQRNNFSSDHLIELARTLWVNVAHNKKTIFFYVLVTLPILTVFIVTSISFYTNSISYDEAYNLQVSRNLAESGAYASNGGVFDGQPKLFDPYISTGPTLLMPIAVIFKLFGFDVWHFRVMMNVIYLTFCVIVVWFVMKATRRKKNGKMEKYTYGILATSFSIAFLGNSILGKDQFFFSLVQGEPLALSLVIVSMLLLQYRKTYYAAIVIGLAILTKLLFIILVPFFILEVILMYKDALFKRIRRVISLSFITLLPSLLFELYKFASMYFSLSTYKASVKEFIHFFKISSGDGALSNTPISLVKDRLLSLLSIDLSAFNLVTVLLVVLVLFAIYKLIRSITQSLSIRIERPLFNDVNIPFIYIFGSVLAWLSWWLLVSGRPWTRYALIPIVMATVTCCAIAYIYNNYKRRNTYYITVALIWTLCCIAIYNNPITNGLIKQNEASVKISQAYGNNDLYSFGWWQNPEIQLISGMHTRPYQSEKAPNDAWVLISDLQKQLDIAGYKRDTSLCDEFVEFDYYRICKISN